MINVEVVNCSLPLPGGFECLPFCAMFIVGFFSVGEGRACEWIVFPPCGEEIDSVFNVGGVPDEIAKTTVDL